MFSVRAGTYPSCSWCFCTTRSRNAASTLPGVVSCALQTASDRAPLIASGTEDPVGLLRALASGLVLVDRLVVLGPRLEDRVDDLPLRLDLVVAREQRR